MPLRRLYLTTLLILSSLLLISGCSNQQPVSTKAQKVVVTSISPLADLIHQVGGDKIKVINLVPAGTDPHEYEPKPDAVRQVASAQIFFANGVGEELYLEKLVQNAGNPSLRTVVLSDGLPIIGKSVDSPGNPHLWLNVQNAEHYVVEIRDILSQAYPDDRQTFEQNAQNYIAQLKDLDQWIQTQISSLPAANRQIIVFHDAWAYYAERYGLTVLRPIIRSGEAEPSAKEYAEIIQLIQDHHVKAIFGEVGFNPKSIQQLAQDTKIKMINDLYDDTLGTTPELDSYIKVMKHDTDVLVSSLH